MQDLLVDQQGDLPEVDWVVELVVYLEEGRELIEGQVVLGRFLFELAEHEWRGVGLLALLRILLSRSIVTPDALTFKSSSCQSNRLTKYFPSKVALYTVSNLPAFIM